MGMSYSSSMPWEAALSDVVPQGLLKWKWFTGNPRKHKSAFKLMWQCLAWVCETWKGWAERDGNPLKPTVWLCLVNLTFLQFSCCPRTEMGFYNSKGSCTPSKWTGALLVTHTASGKWSFFSVLPTSCVYSLSISFIYCKAFWGRIWSLVFGNAWHSRPETVIRFSGAMFFKLWSTDPWRFKNCF